MKKLTIIFLCSFLALSPLFNIGGFSYADETPAGGGGGYGWTEVSTQGQLLAAFKAYCKSRNLEYKHSNKTLSAILAWDYPMLEKYCNALGISVEQLNANIWYLHQQDENSPAILRFWYSSPALQYLNEIYSHACTDAGITGPNEERQVYNGDIWSDDYATCYVFEKRYTDLGSYKPSDYPSEILKEGTPYRFYGIDLYNSLTSTATGYDVSKNGNVLATYYLKKNNINNTSGRPGLIMNTSESGLNRGKEPLYEASNSNTNPSVNSYMAIYKINSNYYLGIYNYYKAKSNSSYWYYLGPVVQLTNYQAAVSSMSIIAKQGLQNGGFAAGKSAMISTGKSGLDAINDFLIDEESDDVTTEELDSEVPPEVPNQSEPDTPTNPDTPSSNSSTGLSMDNNGNFNFSMPDLNINWELDSPVINIFPFSIPFDLYRAYQKLNIEGVAPHYTGTIDLIIYEWNVDFDLSQFDDFAADIRKWILFFYIIGLIIATRSIMHIY